MEQGKGLVSLMEFSNMEVAKTNAKIESEKGYLEGLRQASTVPGFNMDTTASSKHLEKIKKQVNKIVKQEIDLL